jgi:hypothetical protein
MLSGLTSLASAWLTQHHQDRSTGLSQDKVRRQKLYKQFIDEASKLYADALARDKAEISALVSVYAPISRMRVVSSSAVVEKAEAVILMPRGAEQSLVVLTLRSTMMMGLSEAVSRKQANSRNLCFDRSVRKPRFSESNLIRILHNSGALDCANSIIDYVSETPRSFLHENSRS